MDNDVEMQAQIRLLESLLKHPQNMFCADCTTKAPRWASITFGTFVCPRCSGQHRSFGTHITKIKSVNLDKWPKGKTEPFKHLTNELVNSYWECNLPSNYQKPGLNASNAEVVRFMTDKYINRKWVDEKMKYDPFYLFENKRDKFDRWLRKRTGKTAEAPSQAQDVPPFKQPEVKKAISTPTQPLKQAVVQMDDLINLNSKPEDTFTEFQEAKPTHNFDSVLNLFNTPQ